MYLYLSFSSRIRSRVNLPIYFLNRPDYITIIIIVIAIWEYDIKYVYSGTSIINDPVRATNVLAILYRYLYFINIVLTPRVSARVLLPIVPKILYAFDGLHPPTSTGTLTMYKKTGFYNQAHMLPIFDYVLYCWNQLNLLIYASTCCFRSNNMYIIIL